MSTTEFLRIGPRIATQRKRKGWSQADLAARMNTDQQIISRYEKDTAGNMSLKKIEEFAEALEVSPSALMGIENVTIHAENSAPTHGAAVYQTTGSYHYQTIAPEFATVVETLRTTYESAITAKDELIERLKTENEQLRRDFARNYIVNEGPK